MFKIYLTLLYFVATTIAPEPEVGKVEGFCCNYLMMSYYEGNHKFYKKIFFGPDADSLDNYVGYRVYYIQYKDTLRGLRIIKNDSVIW